jgi:hypothetical protein
LNFPQISIQFATGESERESAYNKTNYEMMKGRCEAEQPGYFTQQPVMWPHSLIKLSLDIIIYPATAGNSIRLVI